MAAKCCVSGFKWDGTPTGTETKIGNNDTYIAGSNSNAAILVITDLFGWRFTNTRLLADDYATEANATVYIPDLYHHQPPIFEI